MTSTSDRDQVIIEKHLRELWIRFPRLSGLQNCFYQAILFIVASLRAGGTLYICGNGGSAADAEHIVGELMKSFLLPRALTAEEQKKFTAWKHEDNDGFLLATGLQRGIRAISLGSFSSLNTAVANDNHADLIFAQSLYALACPKDVLLAISTSGNARNVILAARTAKAMEIKVIGLSGKSGGELGEWCDVLLNVPAEKTFLVQELHLPVYHTICAAIEEIIIK